MGNPATPSNETDRLSYLHRLASINSRGWYTNTKESPRARVYIHHVGRARGDAVTTSGQPTHQPPIYLRPKRNSRIYFTYALLPPYFQLYRQRREASKRRDRGERERGAEREGECTRTLSGLTKNGFETSSRETVFLRVFVHPRRIVSPFRFERENRKNVTRDFYIPILELICLFDRHGGNRDDDEWTKIKFPSSFHFLRIILNKIIGKVLIG